MPPFWFMGRRIHPARWVFNGLLLLVGLWLLWAGRNIWFPIGLAFTIAMVLDPTVDRLEARGLSRGVATGLVFLIFLGGSSALILLLTPVISDQASQISRDLIERFPDPGNPDLAPVARDLLDRLDAHPALRDGLMDLAKRATTRMAMLLENASQLLLSWIPNLVWLIVIPVLVFYTLIDFHKIYARIILFLPRANRDKAQEIIADVTAVLGQYLRGLAFICLLLSTVATLLLFLLGNRYWSLLGLLAGPLYAIPVVGSLFNAGLTFMVTSINQNTTQALIHSGVLLILTNLIFDQLVTPRVLGKQVGIHPILTIIALTLGFQVAGIAGMLVAVPIAASTRAVALHLIPKLGLQLDLASLDELSECEDETKQEHLKSETQVQPQHSLIKAVVDRADAAPDDEREPRDWALLADEAAGLPDKAPVDEREGDDWEAMARPAAAPAVQPGATDGNPPAA